MIQANKTKLLNFVSQKYQAGEIDDNALIELVKLAGDYLNLKTIKDYAASNNISYNGAKKCRKPVELFGVKFISDNE